MSHEYSTVKKKEEGGERGKVLCELAASEGTRKKKPGYPTQKSTTAVTTPRPKADTNLRFQRTPPGQAANDRDLDDKRGATGDHDAVCGLAGAGHDVVVERLKVVETPVEHGKLRIRLGPHLLSNLGAVNQNLPDLAQDRVNIQRRVGHASARLGRQVPARHRRSRRCRHRRHRPDRPTGIALILVVPPQVTGHGAHGRESHRPTRARRCPRRRSSNQC